MTPLSIILSVTLLCNGALGWGEAEREQILKMHNNYRRTTVTDKGACHMNKIEYDTQMEAAAERYAKGCIYKHKFEDYGENFAYNTNDHPQATLIKTAVDAWYNEINDYTYGQKACGESNTCHYTQIVAASAKKVGCYAHRCPNLKYGAANAWFLVCYYTPKGNWIGEDAYPKGCSTPCKKGQTEDNKLCVGEGEDDEEEGEQVECVDKSKHCQVWKETAQCEMNPKYMGKFCPVACEKCVP